MRRVYDFAAASQSASGARYRYQPPPSRRPGPAHGRNRRTAIALDGGRQSLPAHGDPLRGPAGGGASHLAAHPRRARHGGHVRARARDPCGSRGRSRSRQPHRTPRSRPGGESAGHRALLLRSRAPQCRAAHRDGRQPHQLRARGGTAERTRLRARPPARKLPRLLRLRPPGAVFQRHSSARQPGVRADRDARQLPASRYLPGEPRLFRQNLSLFGHRRGTRPRRRADGGDRPRPRRSRKSRGARASSPSSP